MSAGHWRAVHALAAWLFCVASQASPAAGQIGLISSTGEILAGSSGPNSSTTIVGQGPIFFEPFVTTATMVVGFNVNADAPPGLVAPEIGIMSFEMRFTLDHAASFNLILDFLLRGQLLRLPDQECLGSISLEDISIPTLVRVRDGAEFPLDVVLPGASLDLDATTATFNFAQQDSRVIEVRGDPVETTAYRLNFLVSVTAISQSCEVSARFGADNGSTTECSACVYPGFGDRVRDEDGLFVTVTVDTLCGNETLDVGEQCDFGSRNGTAGSCCDAFCRLGPSSQVCRPATGECDQSETCSGFSGSCPADVLKAPDSPCTADQSPCTADVCDANGTCTHPPGAGATCDDGLCTCDNDGLFCNGKVQCGPSLCIVLPTPCFEDDTCDEERDICVSQFGTPTPTSTPSPTATDATPGAPTPTATSVTPGVPTSTPTPAPTSATPDAPTPTATATSQTPGAPTPTATATAGTCAGDCNGNGTVGINELILGVNISLGNQLASACVAFDTNGNANVAINELIAGVNNALAGCRT